MRIRRRCGPALLQVEDDVRVGSFHQVYLNKDLLPQHFEDWILCWCVEGAVGTFVCKKASRQPVTICCSNPTLLHFLCCSPSLQPFEWHSPLPSFSSTLRGPVAAMGIGGGRSLTSMIRASTAVPEYQHWNSSLKKEEIVTPQKFSSGPREEKGSDLTRTQSGCLW